MHLQASKQIHLRFVLIISNYFFQFAEFVRFAGQTKKDSYKNSRPSFL